MSKFPDLQYPPLVREPFVKHWPERERPLYWPPMPPLPEDARHAV